MDDEEDKRDKSAWLDTYEWGPEPPEMWMPQSEEVLGEEF